MAMNPPSDPLAGPAPNAEPMRVLLYNVPPTSIDQATSFLSRAPFQVESCTQSDDLFQRLNKTAYKLVIVQLPFGGVEPLDVIYNMRQDKHASSRAILVVLAADAKVAEYQPFMTKGISAMFPLSAPAANLETALAAILQVAPRVDARIMVRLSAKVHTLATKHLCQAMNLSRSGMLVGTNLNLPTGTEVVFELLIPGQPSPLLGEAKVARHLKGGGNTSIGLGLHFTLFKADGRARLDAFLKSVPHKRK